MFTGIIQETGVVEKVRHGARSIELVLRARHCARALKVGDSLAVNGCCLTVVRHRAARPGRYLHFDLLRETWDRTNLKAARPGSLVNLERPLRADSRLDGHFVTGHVDGVGAIRRWEQAGPDRLLEISAPKALMRYIVSKGSIAIDGISLTVAAARPSWFSVWIIPHTLKVTAMRERAVGDSVNLETDILAKYVESSATVQANRRAS